MDYEFIGKAVWIKKEKILVISDLHLGYEEMLNEQGVLVPRFQYKETISDLEKIFKKLGKEKIKEIIILGDLKHEFGKISVQEWKDVFGILEFLEKKRWKDCCFERNT